jgi:hypothetical protein
MSTKKEIMGSSTHEHKKGESLELYLHSKKTCYKELKTYKKNNRIFFFKSIQTSNPTTFSTNSIIGGQCMCCITSRILINEDARASLECF